MFAKDSSSIQSSGGKKGKDVPVRKSDRRHLRERVRAALGDSDDKNEDDAVASVLDAVFLQGTLLARNLTLPTERAVLYVRNPSNEVAGEKLLWPYTTCPQVVWIELDHGPHQAKTQVPTVALLSILPSTWNSDASSPPPPRFPVVTVPPLVSKYLCRGAHLMKSGMRDLINVASDKAFPSHSVVGVCIQGNPQPLAVGWLDPSMQSTSDFGLGCKGEGVHIVTCYGDDLWKQQVPPPRGVTDGIVSPMGAPFNAGHYGNVGFDDGQYVWPLVTENAENAEDRGSDEPQSKTADEARSAAEEEKGKMQQSIVVDEMPSSNVEGSAETLATENATNTHDAPPQQDEELSPENLLHEAVCKALVRLSPKTDLPMTVSVFYAQHVLPNRREGTTIQLKQTRYKKFGPYLQEQVERGLLQVGPDAAKKDPLAMLTAYDRRHGDLRPFLQEAKEEKEQASTENTRMVLLDLFVVPNHFVKLLRLDPDVVKAVNATSEARRNTGYLTAKEVRAILDDYVARENLVHPQRPAYIVLDGPMTDALYKSKSNKDGNAPPTQVTRKDLATAWQAKMERAFALVQMPGSQILHMGRGKGPVVTMEVSKRNNKKFVTKVRGMEDFSISGTELQREIAHRFGCAVGIEENPQEKLKKGHVELVLQGNLVDEVEALLIGDDSLCSHGGAKDSPYSIPKNAINAVLRKGVPARKGRSGNKK